MTRSRLVPSLQLIEDPNKKNDFIIFRHQINSKKTRKSRISSSQPKVAFSKKKNLSSKKKRLAKRRKHKTRKYKKSKSFFNIF